MSHYAQIVEPLAVHGPGQALIVKLEVGTPIKCIELSDGVYMFDARVGGAWMPLLTEEDLPAFTDKGRAHRERAVHATLKPGRPLAGKEHVTKPVAFRPTPEQRAWLEHRAKKKRVPISELIRLGLSAIGMPR